MSRYQLRAEETYPDGHNHTCWHIARPGAVFTLCAHRLNASMPVRPIAAAEGIRPDGRCPECWQHAFDDLTLPT
ncbi:hypothetical protein [Streptacidiphilus jiangxiensis]|uniref:Uncharacterized protein n=1 Tax=Streptacidiphilus jiangxiensis TaxID=235985 RepID=A0A1H7H7G0_STRJI|nr:hypothetical protein [Streptacidiphilus jiangxiensis]SEK44930.1 hypothetical protein SAMN05414137_10265 [Streptacidiphilus jiangxiensis]